MENIYNDQISKAQKSIDKHLLYLKERYKEKVVDYQAQLVQQLLDSYASRYKEVLEDYKKDLELLKIKLDGFPNSSQELHLKQHNLFFERRLSAIKLQTESTIRSVLGY